MPRLVVGQAPTSGGRQEVNGTLGKMFEAQVRDVAVRARPRHMVLTGDQIDAVVPSATERCDIVVADTDHWLLVEVGLQTLSVGVGLGQPPSIKDKCGIYHEKADQAEATRKHMAALAESYGLIPPTGSSILVVSDVVPHTVPLVGELRRQRPRRSPLFVANFDEFELLVTGGTIWSITHLVWRWQQRQEPVPLLMALAEAQELTRIPRRQPGMDVKAWVDILGVRFAA